MKKAGPKLTPRAWWLFPTVFIFLSAVSYSILVVLATTGTKRKDCPCEEPEDKYDVEFGKECCIHFTQYDFCTASQCLCATPENIATYDHVTGSVHNQFTASNIHCKDKEKILKDIALIGVIIAAVVGTVFLITAVVIICRYGIKKRRKAAATAAPAKGTASSGNAVATNAVKAETGCPPEGSTKDAPGATGVAQVEIKVTQGGVGHPDNGEIQPTDTAKI